MQMLIDHARNFPTKIAGQRQDFADLARGQQPLALFISCSDSRVWPSLITGSRPGELFELRTAGNIESPFTGHRRSAASPPASSSPSRCLRYRTS